MKIQTPIKLVILTGASASYDACAIREPVSLPAMHSPRQPMPMSAKVEPLSGTVVVGP